MATSNPKLLKKLRAFLYDIRLKWYNIGIALEIKKTDLDEIKEKCKDDPGRCLVEMIDIWLRSFDEPPSRKALAQALESPAVNERALAAKGICLKWYT